MHNLFTPIEVVKNRINSYPPQALLRFQEELYGITKPRISSLADERKKLWTWLKTLSPIERQQVSTFHSPEFACLLGRIYKEWLQFIEPKKYRFFVEQEHYHIQNERSFRNCRNLQEKLFNSVLLVSKGQLYEAITLEENLLRDSQEFFNLLDQLKEGIVQIIGQFTPEELKTGRALFQIEIDNQSKQLGVWVGTLIMRQISLSYKLGLENIQNLCQYEKNQQKEYSNLWKQLQKQEKEILLNEALKKSPQEILTGYMYSVAVARQFLPVVYVQGQKEKLIQSWVNTQGKDIFNKLTFTKLNQSFSIYNMYRLQIILQIEAKLSSINKVNKEKKVKMKKRKGKSNQSPAKTLKQKLIMSKQLEKKGSKVQENLVLKTSELKQVQKWCKQVEINLQKQHKNKSSENQVTSTSSARDSIQMGQLKQMEPTQNIPNYQQNQKQQIPIKKQANQVKKQSLDRELLILYNKIKEDCRAKYRKIILNRLTYIFEKLGFGCKPYGSFASQLSLPDSDLDISVDSSILNYFQIENITYRNQIILSMQYLIEVLKSYKWISGFRLLDRAKVPLLTFQADASCYFQVPFDQKLKTKLNGKKLDPEKSKVIVDLTIQPYANTPQLPHCGLQSTESLKTWLKIYPILQKMIILLKIRLRQVKMNKTYQGGIGSYTLSLLCIAYLRSLQQVTQSIEKILEGFAIFLKDFLFCKWTIDPEGQVPLIKQPNQTGPNLKHPYDGHNLLQKSSRYVQAFQAIMSWDGLIKQKN